MFLGWLLFPAISPVDTRASRYKVQGWPILATEHGSNNNKICCKAVWHIVLNLACDLCQQEILHKPVLLRSTGSIEAGLLLSLNTV